MYFLKLLVIRLMSISWLGTVFENRFCVLYIVKNNVIFFINLIFLMLIFCSFLKIKFSRIYFIFFMILYELKF